MKKKLKVDVKNKTQRYRKGKKNNLAVFEGEIIVIF